MMKIKKKILTILLGFLAAICLCFGITLAKTEKQTVSAATTFTETTTVVSNIHLRSKRLLVFLETHDYASVGSTNPASASYADYNTLDMIQVYVGDTCVTLGEALERASGDTNVYYNVWNETGSISFPLIPSLYTASTVTKIVIPAGTQFPSYAYTNNSGSPIAYTADATYTFTNNDFANPDWSTSWTVSVEYPPIDFAETETTVSSLKYQNSRLGLFISENDYANASNNAFTITEDQLVELYTLEKITVNGTSLADIWTGDVGFLHMWTEKALWVPMSAPTSGTVVKIPAGTQFPSYAFVSEGATTCYVTPYEIAYKYDGSAWNVDYSQVDFAETETTVSSLKYQNSRLGLFISENDYANASNNAFTITEDQLVELYTLEKITVNGTSLADIWTGDVGFLHMWTEKALWVPMSAPTSGTVVKIPAGTQFPSYAFVSEGATTCYVTPYEIAYKYDGSAWSVDYSSVDFAETATTVSRMEWVENVRLMISLTPNDYGTATENLIQNVSADKMSALNTLDKIFVNGSSLRTLGVTTADLNYWTYWGRFTVALTSAPTKVVFEEGTQFPSMAFAKDGATTCYVLNEAIAFKYENGAWVEKINFTETETTVSIHAEHYSNNRIGFLLGTSDYSAATYAFSLEKLEALNTLTSITYNDKALGECYYMPDAQPDPNIYLRMFDRQNTMYFPVEKPVAGDVIKIAEGTQFPSYAYVSEGATTCYVTPYEITYKYDGSAWSVDYSQVDFAETPTSIQKADFNDTKETANNVFYFWLTESDYGTTTPNVDVGGIIGGLNTYEYIEIDGVKLSKMNLGAQWINFFTRWGALGLQLTDYAWDEEPSYVYIKAGCQIPSLSFAKDGSVPSLYVIEEDTWLVYNEYRDVWEITAQAPENLVEAGDILPENESIANRIFLGWELDGKLYKGGEVAPVAGIANAVYLDYALEDGASIRMADNADESGIRFTAFLQEESYKAYSAYIHSVGVLVLPLELLGSEEFTVNHSEIPVNFYALKEKGYTFTDGVLTTRATIQTVRATNYNRDYAARAYVCVNYADGSTGYAYGYFQEENHVRNIYEVASAAYKAEEGTPTQRSVLEGYASKIADITFDGSSFTITQDTVDSAVTSLQTVSIEDSIVKLALTSNGTSEPLLIINGEAIRSNTILEKAYENNLFTVSFLYATDSGLTYYASNDAMQQFFQDYFALYTMAGDLAVTHSQVSNGPTYQQDWYMNAMAWFKATNLISNNSSANENATYSANENATYSAEDYALFYLNNIDVDKNGNVYSDMNDKSPNTSGNGPDYTTVTSYYLMNSQGWPLPNMESKGWEGYHAEFNNNVTDEALKDEMTSQADFYKTTYENSSKWKVNGSSFTQVNGVAPYTGTAKTDLSNVTGATNAIVYEATGISYSSYNAPFVEVRLLIDDSNKVITDYAIEWQTGGTWYSVKQSEYANNPYELPNATGMYRSFFPLYTHANYGAGKVVYGNNASSEKTITGLRVVLIAKDATSNVTVHLDYVRATADSRHSVNGPKYILSLNEYAANHNDLEVLENNITRARKAMLFQLHPLQGINGLVNLSYLHRHDSYQGAANNFWDIYAAGNLNTDANIYFYEALLALAEMEEQLALNGISVSETASIEWHDLSGNKQTATWDSTWTAEVIRGFAETVKTKIQNTFYNTTTGRFAWSVRDVDSKGGKAAGSLMDYGFTEINLRAIEAGIASDAQASSIMAWINGTITVSGDKVSGSGIYEQPFAPVTTTVDNKKYYIDGSYLSSVVESDFTEFYYDEKFGVLCQDGGTIMHVSYYDLLARAKVLGVDNAYSRLTAIQEWFVDVQNANSNANGYADFFKNYYTASGALQGGEEQGKYGLHDEFKEAVMVMATAPKIFLGLEAHYDTLTIAPNLGSNLTHFGMENLAFAEKTYACYATATSITLSGIKGNVNSGLQVTLKLAYNAGQSVYLNGKLLDSSLYTIENGYVVVTTDFANLSLQVK